MTKLESRNSHFHKSDIDGVYNWPQNRLKWGRGSERPAAHTQQKLTQVPPPPPPGLEPNSKTTSPAILHRQSHFHTSSAAGDLINGLSVHDIQSGKIEAWSAVAATALTVVFVITDNTHYTPDLKKFSSRAPPCCWK